MTVQTTVQTKAPPEPARAPVDVYSLGRQRARRASRRRRTRSTALSMAAFAIVAAVAGLAVYVGVEVYSSGDGISDEDLGPGVIDGTDATKMIERLEQQPKWLGPGTPEVGIGG